MLNKIKLVTFLSLSLCNCCFADSYIQPTKYDDQEEVLVQGGSMIVSNKMNSVIMYQTSKKTYNRKGNFYFNLLNRTDRPINFYFSNLQVTDQWGRHVKVVHKNTLISNKESEMNWRLFGSAFCTTVDYINAQDAGTSRYYAQNNSSSHSKFKVRGSEGWVDSSASKYSSSTTSGVIYNEGARQQAVRQAGIDASYRDNAIVAKCEDWKHALTNYYFDSTTVFPGSEYGANFQVDIDKDIEKDLQYLLFTYDMDGEQHTFCYYCGNDTKKGPRARY